MVSRDVTVAMDLTLVAVLSVGAVAVYRGADRRPAATGLAQAEALRDTSRASLDAGIEALRARVATDAGDIDAAVRLAEALMRAARVHSDAALPLEAERVLRSALQHSPDPLGERMLATVYLSQHRFQDGLDIASRALKGRPADAWLHAVAGDAMLELGRYDEAFAMFDRAAALKPDSGVYARIAYARELQGDVDGAIAVMRMAAEATPVHDLEAQAWVFTQLGLLHLHRGALGEAERAFKRADVAFPSHPYPLGGKVRLAVARGDFAGALRLIEGGPETPETLAMRGDLLRQLGRAGDAETAYRDAERLEREGWEQEEPQPAALARFLAERDRGIAEAVTLAERAAAGRTDIHTMDALAWSYFKAGRVADASAAIQRALRTGTRDPRIRCHARAIEAARTGDVPDRCDPLSVA